MEDLLIFVRFVHFAAVMSLFGASLFPFYALAPFAVKDRRLRRVGPVLAGMALLSAIAWLLLEGSLMSGQRAGFADPRILGTVLHATEFGRIWQWRLVLLALLTGFALAGQLVPARWYLRGVAILSGLAVATLAGIGHGAMGVGREAWLHLGNQAAHMLAASVWVGGLAALLALVREPAEHAVLARALRRFSTVGVATVLVILASGLLNSWFLVGSLQALGGTPYGKVLLGKLMFFTIMIALALYNRLLLLPRLNSRDEAVALRHLRRSVAIEQGCALLVIAAVSILGTMEPAFGMAM